MGLLDRVGRFIDDVLLLPDDVRERLEEAEALLEAERWDEAEERLLALLRDRSSLARAWVGLAQAREGLGDAPGAREAVREARELAPEETELALWAARLALDAGDLEGATEAAREAASRFAREGGRRFAEACAIRGWAEWRRGRPDRAARELRKAVAASPGERPLRIALVEALADAGRTAAARGAAAGIDAERIDDAGAERLGLALARAGARAAAQPWLVRAADAGSARAAEVLARAALARDELDDAEARARGAVAQGGGATAMALLAEVLVARGAPAEAADAFGEASRLGEGEPETAHAAVRIAPLDDPQRLARHAEALEQLAPGDDLAAAARAWVALSEGRTAEAQALPAASEEPRAALALAEVTLRQGRPHRALEALERFEALAERAPWAGSDRPVADRIRRDALRASWRGAAGEVDLAAAIDAVARFGAEHGLGEVERRAAGLRDALDQPVLLAVLGEFNAGKSTLVNAFVGADVAPTGIVPTTATLNELRSGAERRVRVVLEGGTTREGRWDALGQLLEEAAGEAVDHVEITLPSETLERMRILDTPGTNAPSPDHERLAREAAERADVVLWVFDASQAGKATEGHILRRIARGRPIISVLNKKDRLDDSALGQVRARLRDELAGVADEAVAISARQALRARTDADDDGWRASGFAELVSTLERRVVERSREVKRAACAARMLELLDRALATEADEGESHDRRIAALESLEQPLAAAGERLRDAVDDVVGELEGAQQRALAEAAQEVLAFVRPRRSRFERHGAHPEDRAFLADVLERRLGAAVEASERGLRERLAALLADALAAHPEPPSIDALRTRARAAVAPPLAGFWGLQRGVLAGGALGRFFEDVLPRTALSAEAIAGGLAATRADPRAELRPALLEASGDLLSQLEAERVRALERERAERARLGRRVYGPLAALREVLAELSPVDPGAPEGA